METMKGRKQRRKLSNPACIFTACFTGGAPLAVKFAVKARAVQTIKTCLGATVIITAFFNEVMDITKTVKTLNLAKKRILPNLAKKRILPNK